MKHTTSMSVILTGLLAIAAAGSVTARGLRVDTGSPSNPNDGWNDVTVDFTQLPASLALPSGLAINPLSTSNPLPLSSLTLTSTLAPTSIISGWDSSGAASVLVYPSTTSNYYDAQLPPYDTSVDPTAYFVNATTAGLMWLWATPSTNPNPLEQVIFFNLAGFPAGTPINDSFGTAAPGQSGGQPAGTWEIEFNCATTTDAPPNGGCQNGASLLWSGGPGAPVLYTATQSVLLATAYPYTGTPQLTSPDGGPLLNEFVYNNGQLYPPPGWTQTTIAAPLGLAAAPSSSGVTLTWTAAAGATSYNVYQGTTSAGESTTPVQSGLTTATATLNGLTPGQQYFFTITAVYNGVVSANSTEASATVLPAAPTGLTAVAASASVTLSWSASTGAMSYAVYQGTSAGAEASTAIQSNITATTATVSGLTNGQTYYFKVAAIDAAGGTSSLSTETSAMPTAPVTTPTASTPTPSSHGGGALGLLDLLLGGLLLARRLARTRYP